MKLPRLAAPLAGRGSCGRAVAVWFAAGFGIALSVSAVGQTTQPAGADTKQLSGASTVAPDQSNAIAPIERQPISRRSDSTSGRNAGTGAGAVPSTFDVQRVLLALLAVVGLIFLMRLVARRLFPGVASARSSAVVRVHSRTVISPKQQILLLQVGQRMIVVGDSGTQMSALAEVTDPDEIALLIGQVESEKSPITSAFGGIFGKAQKQFEQLMSKPSPTDDAAESDVDDKPAAAPSEQQLVAAQSEIQDLMQRVRGLSQQFRKS